MSALYKYLSLGDDCSPSMFRGERAAGTGPQASHRSL